ncbi:hypothetical protein GGS21DRAFT_523309 [Xylaria nigripes]|nr:hypothetical protein GGS21DRAFT_523309 [Xylaria nigripes]
MPNPREDPDLPIALRRKPRRCVNAAPAESPPPTHLTQPHHSPTRESTTPETPRRTRSKKRVRFSDLGPELSQDDAPSSTGLTPMVKRSSLGEPYQKRRRSRTTSTTSRRRAMAADVHTDESMDDIDILSLPSGHDDGGRRRVRRDRARFSEEVAPTRRRTPRPRTRRETEAVAAEVEAEIQRLRSELADRDAQIARLNDETLINDTDRIVELEQEIKTLRAELAKQQLPATVADEEDDSGSDTEIKHDLPSKTFHRWKLDARDPFSGRHPNSDDDRDVTMADVACSTPSRPRKNPDAATATSASASFPTPPSTSPIQPVPAIPISVRRAVIPMPPNTHIGIQACLPDPEKEALQAELVSLRSEISDLTAAVEIHAAQQTRLSEKLASALPEPTSSTPENKKEDLEASLNKLLQTLSDRTTSLQDLHTSLNTLGFAGTNATEILATITDSFRAARLELEYLTPGEIPLPLSSRGAEVLDLVLTHLRDLARKAREDEDAIEEYRKIELSLRQQLEGKETARQRVELEAELARLRSETDAYRHDVARLEAELKEARDVLSGRDEVVEELEGRLSGARALAEDLGAKVKELQRRRDVEGRVRNQAAGAALAVRDARVLALRREIGVVDESLRGAHEMVLKLRIENKALSRRVEVAEGESLCAKEEVERLKAEVEGARGRRAGSATPEPRPGSFLSGDLARSGGSARGRAKGKGWKSDTELGLLEEEKEAVKV